MLRGAFIGFGNVARHGHLPGWLARRDVEIVAAADVRADARPALAERLPAARWHDSFEAMLDSERLDFVDICTPPASHADGIRRALERGLHVLCEKPLVLSGEELRDLAALARQSERVLGTVHNWRHAPILARAAQLVREGAVGKVRCCRWETLRDRPAAAAGSTMESNWRVDPAISGGGILIDHGWHALYMIQSWLSGEADRVSGRLETRRHREWPIEDTAEVLLDYPAARAEIFLTWSAAERANRVRLEGTDGTIALDGRTLELHLVSGERIEGPQFAVSLADGSHHADWFGGVIEEFLGEIREPSRGGRSLAEAERCLRWIRAAQESSRRGGEPISGIGQAAAAVRLEAAR